MNAHPPLLRHIAPEAKPVKDATRRIPDKALYPLRREALLAKRWKALNEVEGRKKRHPESVNKIAAANAGRAVKQDREVTKKAILRILRIGPMSNSDITAAIGKHPETVRNMTSQLVREGKLEVDRNHARYLYSLTGEQRTSDRLRAAMKEAGE